MDGNIIEKIKREILNSENLDETFKLDALFLLDEASRAIPVRKNIEVVRILENLYQEVIDEDYKQALSEAIKKYKSEIRVLSYGCPEESVTLRGFLESLKIPVDGVSDDLLDLKLTVGIDDGMGYTPNGFLDVIDSYHDKDNGEIRIWA